MSKTKSIKIRMEDYLSLEELRIELIKTKGTIKNKLETLHWVLEEIKKERMER